MSKARCSKLVWAAVALCHPVGAQSNGFEYVRTDYVQLKISPVDCGCEIVKFPGVWTRPNGVPLRNGSLIFRALGNASNTLLVANELGWVSTQKYKLRMGSRITVEPATDAEWDSATPLEWPKVNFIAGRDESPQAKREPIKLFGKTFPRSGQRLNGAIPSSDNRLLAVYSYNGAARAMEVPGGYAALKGEAFVEVYNLSTGALLAKVEGDYAHTTGRDIFSTTSWVTSDMLCVDLLNREKKSVVFCRFSK